MHGLPNIIRTKYFPLKIIWTILFLTAVGVLIYFLYNTIQDYLKYEVKTVVRSIDVDEMNFPVVTVCNTNKVTTKKGYDYFLFFLNKYNITLNEYLDYMNGNNDNSLAQKIYFLLQYYYPFIYYYKFEMNQREELFDKQSIRAYYGSQQAIINNYNWIFNPIYGNCLQINSDSNLKIQKYNQNNLNLNLFFIDYKELTTITGKFYNNLQENSFYLFVGDKKSNPFTEQKNLFKFEDDIVETEIKITKSIYNKQINPYSNCYFAEDVNGNFEYPSSLFDRKYYDQIKSAGYEYSQSMCISFCKMDKIDINCSLGFSSIKTPNNNYYNICSFDYLVDQNDDKFRFL